MNLDEFRQQLESYRRAVDEEAASMKDSCVALDQLHALYRKFDSEEQKMADQVLAEWALSDDEKLRFDALALIDELKVASTVQAFRQLANRLASSDAPAAPYELKKVNRIIEDL
jgi:hypothetical protein